jgi:hypothetical protein
VDNLLHWQSNTIPLSWHSDIATLNAAQRLLLLPSRCADEWQAVESQFRDRSSFPSQHIGQMTVYSGLIVTVWKDTCHVIANMLLTWALNHNEPEKSAPARIAKNLIDGRTLDYGGDRHSANFLGTFSDFLLSFLRRHSQFEWAQNGLDRYYHHLAEQIDQLTDVPGMSGRTYITAGYSQSSSYDGEMLLGCLRATGTVDVVKSLSAQLPDILGDNAKSEHILNEVTAFIAHIDRAEKQRFTSLFEYLSGTSSQIIPVASRDDQTADVTEKISHVVMAQRLGNLRASLDQIREAVVNFRTERLRSTQVSLVKMAEVAAEASRSGFTKDVAAFPIALFSSVVTTDLELTPFTLTSDHFPKGALTDPELDQVHFSDDHHSSVVKSHLNQRVTVDLFQTARRLDIVRQVEAPNADVYAFGIRKIFEVYRNAGLHPLAILEDYDVPPWVSEWQRTWDPDRKIPDGLEIVHESASKPEGALFAINGVPFYNGHVAFGGTLILPQESLQKITFRQFLPGTFVDVTFQDDDEDPGRGTLAYRWEREVELSEFPIFLLSYPQET